MKINTKQYKKIEEKYNLKPIEYLNILFIESEDVYSDDDLEKLLFLKIIKKQKNGKYVLEKIGKEILTDVRKIEIAEGVKELYSDLVEIYDKYGYSDYLGGKTASIRNLQSFINFSGIENYYNILETVENYVIGIDDKKFLSRLENLIFKPKNVYQTKFSLEDSKLFGLYEKLF